MSSNKVDYTFTSTSGPLVGSVKRIAMITESSKQPTHQPTKSPYSPNNPPAHSTNQNPHPPIHQPTNSKHASEQPTDQSVSQSKDSKIAFPKAYDIGPQLTSHINLDIVPFKHLQHAELIRISESDHAKLPEIGLTHRLLFSSAHRRRTWP